MDQKHEAEGSHEFLQDPLDLDVEKIPFTAEQMKEYLPHLIPDELEGLVTPAVGRSPFV